jgi:hypothetical protein
VEDWRSGCWADEVGLGGRLRWTVGFAVERWKRNPKSHVHVPAAKPQQQLQS